MKSLFSGLENFDSVPEKEKSQEVLDLELGVHERDAEIASMELTDTVSTNTDIDTDVAELEELLEDAETVNENTDYATERLYKKMVRLKEKYLIDSDVDTKEVSVEAFRALGDTDAYYDFRTVAIEGARSFLNKMKEGGKDVLNYIIEALEKFWNFMVELYRKLTQKSKQQLKELDAVEEIQDDTIAYENEWFPTKTDVLHISDVMDHLHKAEGILIPINSFVMNFVKKNQGLHVDRFPDLTDGLDEHLSKVRDFSPRIGDMKAVWNVKAQKTDVYHNKMKDFKPTSKMELPTKQELEKLIRELQISINNTESNSVNTNKRLTTLLKGKNYMGNAARMKYNGQTMAGCMSGLVNFLGSIERETTKHVNDYIDFVLKHIDK